MDVREPALRAQGRCPGHYAESSPEVEQSLAGLLKDLKACAESIQKDSSLRAVLLTGAGRGSARR